MSRCIDVVDNKLSLAETGTDLEQEDKLSELVVALENTLSPAFTSGTLNYKKPRLSTSSS